MKKNMKKRVAAMVLSASMVMGMSITAFADDTSVDVDAPIYALDVTTLVVPTTYVVAFNPGELSVKTGSTTSTDQVLSKNYGIINKSSKDKIVEVKLSVEDLNNKIQFKNSAEEVTNASADEYAVYLAAAPADATEVQVGTTPKSADKDTAATDLDNVTMTKAADGKQVALKSGDNKIEFILGKATLSPKSGSEVTLGTTDTNDVSSNYEVSALAADGKGITAFTFTGAMKSTAAWEKLTNKIKITCVYTSKNAPEAPSATNVVNGTGAVYNAPESPTPTIETHSYQLTADTPIEIPVKLGTGDTAATGISKVMDPTDTYEYLSLGGGSYVTYDSDNKTLTLTAAMVNACIGSDVSSLKVIFNDTAETMVTITLTK